MNKKLEIIIISSFDNSNIVYLPISTYISILNIEIDIATIDVDTYLITCKLNITNIFAISMRDLEYQATKKVRLETNLKSVILKEYYDFLNVFSKKNFDILFLIKIIIIKSC